MYRGRVVLNIGTLSQTTSLPLVILPDMTTDVMCMCHPGLAARQPIAPGGVRCYGAGSGSGGGTIPEDISANISQIFVVLVHARTCLLRVGALRVYRCVRSFVFATALCFRS